MTFQQVDIKENEIFELSPELLNTLLKDRTLSKDNCQVNIFWATDSYAHLGKGYQYDDKITVDVITGTNGNIIVPRAIKSREQQKKRSRRMAEVFTPSWVCNKQNNLVDNAWFGRENVFNTEVDNYSGRTHSWIPTEGKIEFPNDKSWRDYVTGVTIEITCGEAPYLVSRYDTVTGDYIPIEMRIGLLDRKLRIVGENTETAKEWQEGAIDAFKSTYGYEWQGDNIVLARETMLYTFIDYYRARFGEDPELKILHRIAEIISWNIWQMDGLKSVIPNSCVKIPKPGNSQPSLFDREPELCEEPTLIECPGCNKKKMFEHTGIYCKIMDWEMNKPIEFASLYDGYPK